MRLRRLIRSSPYLMGLSLLLVAVFPVHPQDDDPFADGFGIDDDAGFFLDEAGEPDGVAEDQQGTTVGGESTSTPALSWGGRLAFTGRGTVDYDDPADSPLDVAADARLDLGYLASGSELFARFEVSQDAGSAISADRLAANLVDEAYSTFYYDRFSISVGYIKTVWGTGDEIHVVDLLNSDDFSDFINPDYIERRVATGMFKVDVPLGPAVLEVAYVPVLNPDVVPDDGIWAPVEVEILNELAAGYETGLVSRGDLSATEIGAAVDLDRLTDFEDANQLEDAQVGVRLLATIGRFDLGLIYYWGFLKTPVPEIRLADETLANAFIADPGGGVSPGPSPDGNVAFFYPRMHAFGLESAAVLGPFNTRTEIAYYLTDDIQGDDPEIPNNSINYLAGFDVDLPVSNLNLNIQGAGSVLLASDSIDAAGQIAEATPLIESALLAGGADPFTLLFADPSARYNYQYNDDDIYTSHLVTVVVADAYRNARIRPEVAVAFGVEYQDWRVRPAVEWDLLDDATAEIAYTIFAGDDEGRFGYFEDNDYLQVRVRYSY